MVKVSKIAAGLAVLPMLAFSAPVYADSPGQLQSGSNTYVVKNATQSGAYGATAAAKACGDVMQYSIDLHNTEFGKLTNIVVKAGLPTGGTSSVSNMTATPASGGTTGTSASVTVTGLTAGQNLAYVAGSTQLYNESGTLVNTLADGITSDAGLNVGDLNGSTTEFVNFKAKVTCDTTVVTKIQVCELATKKVITINEADFNSAKHSKDLSKCAATPATTKLVNTGPGEVAALFAGVTAVAALGYNWVLRRQNAR